MATSKLNLSAEASGQRVLMPAGEIGNGFSGGPSIVVSSKLVPTGSRKPDFGFDTIFVSIEKEDVCFFRDGDMWPANDCVEIHHLPMDLLGIVAAPDEVKQLSALWTDKGLQSPPLIPVNHPAGAIGPLLSLARAEMDAIIARCAELQKALVRTREEFEETRIAMHGAMRTLSHRYATKMNPVVATVPSAEKVRVEAAGTLRHIYPVGTHLLTCFALYVNERSLGADSMLRVALTGVESGRVLGEWRMPGDDVREGWNAFDFPVPVAAVFETVSLNLSLEASPGSWLTLSLAEETAASGSQSPAIRFWTADPCGRFPLANHWVWSALGETFLAPGTVALVTDDLAGRMKAYGNIEASARGREGFPVAHTLRGGSSLLWLPRLNLRNAQAVCIELRSTIGDVRNTHFEFVAQADGHAFGSGMRSFAFPERTLRLGLSLPADLPAIADLCLRIEDGARVPDDFAVVEILRIEIVSGRRTSANPEAAIEYLKPEALPQASPLRTGRRFTGLESRNYSRNDKYELVELTLENLEFGGYTVPLVKFKVSLAGGRLSLEFRRGEKWPEIFRKWPGRHKDNFSELFHVGHSGDRLTIDGEVANNFDRELIATLGRLMPMIVCTAVQRIDGAAERLQPWLDAARSFSAAAKQPFGILK